MEWAGESLDLQISHHSVLAAYPPQVVDALEKDVVGHANRALVRVSHPVTPK